ncbi:MAG: Do family serine endopeptidase [Bdellovibrionota bacterium]|jgi:serine protease Do
MAWFSKTVLVALLMSLISQECFADTFLREGIPPVVTQLQKQNKDTVVIPRFDVLAEALSPMVVNIAVETATEEKGKGKSEESGLPFFMKKFPSEPMRSLGSGIIVSEDGYIVTNFHVIEKSKTIIVRLLNDKTEYQAEIIGVDKKTDLAVIKIKSEKKLQAAYVGDSDLLHIGEWVLAIGNQFQLGQTVTAGIVSAKSRKVPTSISGPYDNFIQTDASINPGSSGGPLFNSKGQLVGINTAIFSPGRSQFGGTGFNIGIGFAIPINMVKNVITQLKEKGAVTRGLLGVIIQSVNTDVAEALDVKPAGALVAEVMSNTPAAKAGFKVKDILLTYAGHPIEDHDDLPILVANTAIGTKVDIEVWRDGKIITLSPKIMEMTNPTDTEEEETKTEKEKQKSKLGLSVQTVTDDIAKIFELTKSGNVIVTSVEKDSPAEKAGIVRGDVIEEIANTNIKNQQVFDRVDKELTGDKPLLVLIRKREGTRFLTINLE